MKHTPCRFIALKVVPSHKARLRIRQRDEKKIKTNGGRNMCMDKVKNVYWHLLYIIYIYIHISIKPRVNKCNNKTFYLKTLHYWQFTHISLLWREHPQYTLFRFYISLPQDVIFEYATWSGSWLVGWEVRLIPL